VDDLLNIYFSQYKDSLYDHINCDIYNRDHGLAPRLLTFDAVKSIIAQIVDGVNFLHSLDIIHRDLQPK
jgi:serine/threonine protein kinase